ncbi:longitudinals lacking protein, isoforms H/M/V-like isoform X1 [Schistocerca piceifrons]|uniref:longitudinals lacking protein, isoforms H/M/V-like isoform X1 n=1 Tax=Schistocerca piceifrons TaxID=274613 RepID=UPI001F5F2396|nr:longitudinals lacking protein, isoforms H/M/V-like isoform X1 [Schistocerca piceifrons]
MGSEQQFCLRWNNHQSTLVAVFDTLLESGTLVDCTLAAEGQYLKAHKVVLSACSPYFELLLSQHYEKHPIVILKDVKFQELKAMMDYMYRGEVNISQDQLGALLKAAESLQIKGLSDSGGGGTEREVEPKRRKESVPPPPTPARTPPILQHSSSGLTIEHRRTAQPSQVPQVIDLPEDAPPPMPLQKMATTREGSISPVSRKRKKHRRRSSCDENSLGAPGVLPSTDNHETSSSCELPPQSQVPPAPSIPATITPVTSTPIPKPSLDTQLSHTTEEKNSDSEIMSKPLASVQGAVASPQTMPIEPEPVVHKVEPQTEPLLEPKSEYLEEVNDDSVEDLTLDDDMDDMDQPRAGPSHGGEGSSSQGTGFAPWHVTATDRSTDEVFMAAQEAVGAHRDSQGYNILQNTLEESGKTPVPPSPVLVLCKGEPYFSAEHFINGENKMYSSIHDERELLVRNVCSTQYLDWNTDLGSDSQQVHSFHLVETSLHSEPDSNFHNVSKQLYNYTACKSGDQITSKKVSLLRKSTTSKNSSRRSSKQHSQGRQNVQGNSHCQKKKKRVCNTQPNDASHTQHKKKSATVFHKFDYVHSTCTSLNAKVPCIQCQQYFCNNNQLMKHLLSCKQSTQQGKKHKKL